MVALHEVLVMVLQVVLLFAVQPLAAVGTCETKVGAVILRILVEALVVVVE